MNSKNLFIFNSLTCLFFGIPLLFIPGIMIGQYLMPGDSLTPITNLMTQAYGGMLIMVGIILWIARGADNPSTSRTALLWSVLAGNVIALYVWISGFTEGLINNMIFGSFVIISITALWAAYLLFIKKENGISTKIAA